MKTIKTVGAKKNGTTWLMMKSKFSFDFFLQTEIQNNVVKRVQPLVFQTVKSKHAARKNNNQRIVILMNDVRVSTQVRVKAPLLSCYIKR